MGTALLGASCAIGCAFVMLRAGWWKLRHRPAFVLVLRDSLAARQAGWLSVVVPGIELAVGAGALVLVLPPSVRDNAALPVWLPLLGLIVLGVAFSGYGVAQLASGRGGARCGCVDAEDRLGSHTVVRAVAVAAGGAAGWLTDGAGAADQPPGLLWSVTAGAGGVVVAVVLLVGLPLISPLWTR